MKKTFQAIPLILLLTLSLSWASNLAQEQASQSMNQLTQSIQSSLTLCYAQEGFYPSTIDYLIDRYQLKYDEEVFYVYYKSFASNLRPDVKVFKASSP